MLSVGRDELICDLAETYGIYNYKNVPVGLLSILACGLPENSRIMKKINGEEHTAETYMLAAILDGVNMLVWQKTEDGERNRNKPESVLAKITGQEQEPDKKANAYDTPEDFECARAKIIEGGE